MKHQRLQNTTRNEWVTWLWVGLSFIYCTAYGWLQGKENARFIGHSNTVFGDHLEDLPSCDFLFFPKMELKLKGYHFDTVEEIKHALEMHKCKWPQYEFHGVT